MASMINKLEHAILLEQKKAAGLAHVLIGSGGVN